MKTILKAMMTSVGYEVRRISNVAERGFVSHHLRALCRPRTVIDVGVGRGTWPLYEAFPDARFILVEPLCDFADVIAAIRREYDCKVYYQAVGRVPGTVEIAVDTRDKERSSLHGRAALTKTDSQLERRQVEVTTLDDILRDNGDMNHPLLLKIDTEGHELEALQGATELLQVVDTIIAEVSVAQRFVDGYSFEDLVCLMKERGFTLIDVLKVTYIDNEPSPRFLDAVFQRRDRRPVQNLLDGASSPRGTRA